MVGGGGAPHETTTQDAVGESQVTWDPPDLSKLVHFTRMYSVGCVPPAAVPSLGIVCRGGGRLPGEVSARDPTCSGRTQVLYKAHVLYCALFSRSCFFFSGNC